jgi:hypothetical protein
VEAREFSETLLEPEPHTPMRPRVAEAIQQRSPLGADCARALHDLLARTRQVHLLLRANRVPYARAGFRGAWSARIEAAAQHHARPPGARRVRSTSAPATVWRRRPGSGLAPTAISPYGDENLRIFESSPTTRVSRSRSLAGTTPGLLVAPLERVSNSRIDLQEQGRARTHTHAARHGIRVADLVQAPLGRLRTSAPRRHVSGASRPLKASGALHAERADRPAECQ